MPTPSRRIPARDTDTSPGRWSAGAALSPCTLSPEQAATVIAALEDAATLRREAASYCPDCPRSPAGLCEDHEASLDAAGSYDALRWQLEPDLQPGSRTPGPASPSTASQACPTTGIPAAEPEAQAG